MIEIKYSDLRVECTGHAGYAESGHDIVCAAVTALCLTLGRFVEQTAQSAELMFDTGHIIVESVPKKRYRALTRLVYGIFEAGLMETAKAYPQYVSMTKSE